MLPMGQEFVEIAPQKMHGSIHCIFDRFNEDFTPRPSSCGYRDELMRRSGLPLAFHDPLPPGNGDSLFNVLPTQPRSMSYTGPIHGD